MKDVWFKVAAASVLGLVGCAAPGGGGSDAWEPAYPAWKPSATTAPYAALGTIERNDTRFDKLIAKDAQLEILVKDLDWCEGPVWVKDSLLFSDIPPNKVLKWQEGQPLSVFLKASGFDGPIPRPGNTPPDEPGSNGLTLDKDGRLVLFQHGNRRVARLEADGKFTVLADKFEGKRFNSPNDGVYHSNGDLYFTDPPYGLTNKEVDKNKELDFQGVYRLGKDGKVTLLTKEMTRPNGIALSPDEKTLYVANSDPAKAIWMSFPVKADGTLGAGKVLFDSTPWVKAGKKGLPDGLKVDKDGNLYATGPGGLIVFAPDGTVLGSLNTGQATSNCAFGGDGSWLYVTVDMFVARIKTGTKGKGF